MEKEKSTVGKVGYATIAAIFLTLALVTPAFAATYNIIAVAPATASETVNGAIFETHNIKGTGTGAFDPFLQINDGNDNPIYGYNTDGTLEYWTTEPTYALPLSAITDVTIDGIKYREFLLDSNQIKTDMGRLLVITELTVYLTTNNLIDDDNFGTEATEIWDLGDNVILYNAMYGDGQGSTDLRLLIPDSLFDPLGDNTYVIMWIKFGNDDYPNNDGFEEWGIWIPEEPTLTPEIPEFSTIALPALSLVGLFAFFNYRKRKQE